MDLKKTRRSIEQIMKVFFCSHPEFKPKKILEGNCCSINLMTTNNVSYLHLSVSFPHSWYNQQQVRYIDYTDILPEDRVASFIVNALGIIAKCEHLQLYIDLPDLVLLAGFGVESCLFSDNKSLRTLANCLLTNRFMEE